MNPISVTLPPELIETIAQRVVDLIEDARGEANTDFLNVDQAAKFLACPTSRIYALVSVRRIPHERDGSRLLFRRAALDKWVRLEGPDGLEPRCPPVAHCA